MLTCHRNGDVTINGTRYTSNDGARLNAALISLDYDERKRARLHLEGRNQSCGRKRLYEQARSLGVTISADDYGRLVALAQTWGVSVTAAHRRLLLDGMDRYECESPGQ